MKKFSVGVATLLFGIIVQSNAVSAQTEEELLSHGRTSAIQKHFQIRKKFSEYKSAARRGDILAKYLVASTNASTIVISREEYTTRNTQRAKELYLEACNAGFPRACTEAALYIDDPQQKNSLDQRACGENIAIGCYRSGDRLRRSDTSENKAAAVQYFVTGCNLGYAKSCGQAGNAFYFGEVVAQDYALSARYLRIACEGGEEFFCNSLGFQYDRGWSVEQDIVQAAKYYRLGCDEGNNSTACSNIGILYGQGTGVEKSAALSLEYQQKACDMGRASSCSRLDQLWAEFAREQSITSKAISDDGTMFAIGTDGGVLSIYQSLSGDLMLSRKMSMNAVRDLIFSPSGKLIFINAETVDQFGDPVRAQVWDLVDQKPLFRSKFEIRRFKFSPDEKYIGGIENNKYFFYKYHSGDNFKPGYRIHFAPKSATGAWDFSPDGKHVALKVEGGVSIANLESRSRVASIADPYCCSDIVYSPDGRTIASSSDMINGRRRFILWNSASGAKKRELTNTQTFTDVAFSPDGQKVLGAIGGLASQIYDVATGRLSLSVESNEDSDGIGNYPTTFILNGRYLAYDRLWTSRDNNGGIWDAETGRHIEISQEFRTIIFSKDGSRFLAQKQDGRGIITGSTAAAFHLDRQLSFEEQEQARLEAEIRTGQVISERQYEIDRRRAARAAYEADQRARGATQQTVMESILQGASSALNDYNASKRRTRETIQRREDLNNTLRNSSSSSSASDSTSGNSSGSPGSEGGEIALGVTYDAPAEQPSADTESFITVLPDAPPPPLEAPQPCRATVGGCVTPE